MILLVAAGLAVGWAQQVEQLEQTFAFEDIGVGPSDMDWNDQNLRWRGVCDLDGSLAVRRHRVAFVAVAAGAQEVNALVLRVAAGATSVTVDGAPVEPSGGVVTLLDPFKDGFAGGASGFVNTVGTADAVGVTHEVVTVFAPAVDFGGGCPVPGFELHRAAEGVVIDLDARLDGTGPPLAGNFDGFFRAPIEHVDIAGAYPGLGPHPSFLAWAVDVADGTCDDTCGVFSWFDAPDALLVDPRAAPELAATAPLPELPTCTDLVQNGDETGVDCGDAFGSCAPCAALGEVVAWVGNDGLVHVRRWDDPSWTAFGSGLVDPGGWARDATLTLDAGGDPAVAWTGNDGKVHVRQWDGAAWITLGAGIPDPAGGGGAQNSAVVVGDDGVPVVAFQGNDGLVRVRRWDGAAWGSLGPGIPDPGGWAHDPVLALNADDDPVVAWRGNDGSIHAREWDGAAWSALGAGIVDPGGWAGPPTLATRATGEPVTAFAGNDGNVYVFGWDGAAWGALGGPIDDPAWASRSALATGAAGELVLARTSGGEIRVAAWTGVAWTALGTTLPRPAGSPGGAALAVGGSGAPVAAFTSNGDGKVYARRWDGTAWQPLGAGLSDPGGWASEPTLGGRASQSSTNRSP